MQKQNQFTFRLIRFLPWLSVSLLLGLLIQFSGCQQFDKNKSHQNGSNKSIKRGKVLAATYCQSCHLLPEPSLLDSKTWQEGVLPAMGPRLGIFSYGFQQYPSYKNDPGVPPNHYPAKQV